jgi:hypothetical protein
MATPLGEYFNSVFATDVASYGWPGQDAVTDFLIDWAGDAPDVDWVVTNPPFRLGAEFITQALRHARVGVAMFVRTAFVEGAGRYGALFRDTPEAFVLPFVERVVIWRGVLLDPDVPIWTDTGKAGARLAKPTSATSYSWLIWLKDHPGMTQMIRVPPCRRDLTRPGDYPPVPDHLRRPTGGLLALPHTASEVVP